MTDVGGTTHLVTDEAMAAGRRAGCYRAVCGRHLLAASLTAPESVYCRACRRWRGRGVTIQTPAGRRSSAAPLAPPGGQPGPTTGVTDSQLAVLLRQAQWALDDAAHDFPAGRVTTQRREELAVTLEGLAAIARASAPGCAR